MSSASPLKRMTQACGPSSSQSCNFTCPKGGNWYTCRNFPYFTGCCESDPCHNTTAQAACPDLYPASFNPNVYNSILPNDCLNAGSNNWYTCNDTNPTFIGCCRSNPCVQGSCPTTDLIPAAWSTSNPNQLQIFLDAPTTLQPGATPSSTASESGMAMPMPSESENRENSGLSTGAIAGIAIGVIIVILTIVFLFAILMYHRGWHARRKREREIGHHPIPCMTKKEISPQHPGERYPTLW